MFHSGPRQGIVQHEALGPNDAVGPVGEEIEVVKGEVVDKAMDMAEDGLSAQLFFIVRQERWVFFL